MQIVERKTLGHLIKSSEPSTNEEFDQLAGVQNAAAREASNNVFYRSKLNDVRDCFLHGYHVGEGPDEVNIAGIEEITGIKRLHEVQMKDGKPKLDADGDPIIKYLESEEKYYDRVLATLAEKESTPEKPVTAEAVRSRFQSIMDQINEVIVFDPKRKERVAAGPKKVSKQYLVAAITWVKAGWDRAKGVAAKLGQELGFEVKISEDDVASFDEATAKDNPTVLALARAVSEKKRRERAKENIAAEF